MLMVVRWLTRVRVEWSQVKWSTLILTTLEIFFNASFISMSAEEPVFFSAAQQQLQSIPSVCVSILQLLSFIPLFSLSSHRCLFMFVIPVHCAGILQQHDLQPVECPTESMLWIYTRLSEWRNCVYKWVIMIIMKTDCVKSRYTESYG